MSYKTNEPQFAGGFIFRKPPPEGVAELVGLGINSLVDRKFA